MRAQEISYDRNAIQVGILHFGVGNFHRAHLAHYIDRLIREQNGGHWGICGAMLMPQDETLFRALKAQDGIYSLTECGRDGMNRVEWVGSLVQLLWRNENLQEIIEKVADENIKIISLTITEGGYNLDTDTVQDDLKNPTEPKSVFGVVAEGLHRRCAQKGGPLTILSCDNLQHNGDTCKRAFTQFFEQQDAELATWARENLSFPNSMVDRITPATTPADIERINKTLSVPDLAPVYCEDFIQWVVEDNFIAGRPEWEKVGVEFTDNVVPYENMKLSLLNASHTLLSYPSFLSGYRKVDEAMQDDVVIEFIRDFMDLDATPYVPAPGNTDLDEYKRILLERFANHTVSDQIARLCGDGLSKFPVYVTPIAKQMLAGGNDMTRIAYLIAAYRHYLKYRRDDQGEVFELFEPRINEGVSQAIESSDAVDFLKIEAFIEADLSSSKAFVSLYQGMVDAIKSQGAMTVLAGIMK